MRRSLLAFALLSGCSGSDDPKNPASSVDSALAETAETAAPDTAPADAVEDTAPAAFNEKLSAMDLYSDIAKKTVSARNTEFKPTYELWSDGADKTRWIALPAGGKIDNTDMDHWSFPVGTRLWKEFKRDGKRLETRLIEKTGADSYRYGSYVWNDDETEATWTTAGKADVKGTTHDVPKEADCQRCHDGEPSRVLGFSAIQLAKGAPVSLATITPWLKVAPTAGKDYGVPGNATEAAALGTLHANCGNCHNPNDALTYIAAGIELRLYVDERDVKTTKLYTTNVNQSTEKYLAVPYRIEGGNATNSAVWARMNRRDKDQMPPLGTEIVHAGGLAAVKAWIDTLPKP